ncbi:MAG: thiopurine S-methyltransferase [Candidimonas sp.]|nr:MAG: thiopurine S-methyltransferase [Candidimonas sp.]TAM25567.1 MAG: thiopurine S-methyltransferase [Candidimonas sp.]
MEADFWLQRWREGQTRFHQGRVMPLLQKYWPGLSLPANSRVLVPLAGKSLDIIWLAEQGHHVLAVELSALAIEQFFTENNLHPSSRDTPLGRHFVAGRIEVICGDIFALDAATLADCAGFYDRAALIALPPAMRQRYVRHVYGQLSQHCRGLLISLDYPQTQMEGPPFAVLEPEIEALYAGQWEVQTLDQRDVLATEPKFAERGLTHLRTVVYRLDRRPPVR